MEANNMRAMREALEALLNLAYEVEDANSDVGAPRTSMPTKFVIDTVKTALAARPRNCDVGTVDEQAKRYMNFCRNHTKCTECPCASRTQSNSKCEFEWSQMPYEEGGNSGR